MFPCRSDLQIGKSEPPITGVRIQNRSQALPIAAAIGAIISLGGIFLILASHQIISVNVITNLGNWGEVIGYGVCGLGFLFAAVASVKWCCQDSLVRGSIEKNVEEGIPALPEEVKRGAQEHLVQLNSPESFSVIEEEMELDQDEKEQPCLVGEVYLKTERTSPIGCDGLFEFGKRLRNEEKEPIEVHPEDIYLELEGSFIHKIFFSEASGSTSYTLLLPSSLFEGAREGDTVCFYFDEFPCALMCSQYLHPHAKGSAWKFEEYLEVAKKMVRANHIQPKYPEDQEQIPKFMGQVVGSSNFQIDLSDGSKTEISGFEFFEEDQRENGEYKSLLASRHDGPIGNHPLIVCDTRLFFYMFEGFNVQLSDINVIESKGFNGLHQVWIMIPHKIEKNRLEYDADVGTFSDENGERTLYRNNFHPKETRFPFYHYGLYFMFNLAFELKSLQLFYNANRWLQLEVETGNDS